MPLSVSRLEIAEPNCVAEDLDDEIVALNVSTGIYFSMRGAAAALWRDLAGGHPVAELRRAAIEATGSDAPFEAFLDRVLEHRLMRESRAGEAAGGVPSFAAVLQSGDGTIEVEVFDDMKDLILSDPIHDVDDAIGWPRRAPTA